MPSTLGIVASGYRESTTPTLAEEILADAPVFALKLDEASGATATDFSGNSRNGTYTNTANISYQRAGIWANQPYAAKFNGTNAYLEVGSTSSLFGSAQAQTFEAIFYTPVAIDSSTAGTFLVGSDTDQFHPIGLGSVTGFRAAEVVTVATGTGARATWGDGLVIPAGWNHIAVTYSGTSNGWSCYLNGVSLGAPAINGAVVGIQKNVRLAMHNVTYSVVTVAYFCAYQSALSAARVRAHVDAWVDANSVWVTGAKMVSSGTGGDTTPGLLVPGNVADGDLLIATYSWRGANTDYTPPAGSGWTTLVETSASDNLSGIHVFWKIWNTGEAMSEDGASTVSRAHKTTVISLRGAHATAPVSSYTTNGASGSASPSFTGLGVGNNNSALIGCLASVSTSQTEPSGTLELIDMGSASGGASAGNNWVKLVDAGASGSFTGTISGGTSWATVLIEVVPVGAPALTGYAAAADALAPAGLWMLDESASPAVDLSGNSRNLATNVGTPTWGSTAAPMGGTSVSFPGSTDISVASNLGLTSYPITFAAWVYPTTASQSGAFIHVGASNGANGLAFGVGNSTLDSDGLELILLVDAVAWQRSNVSIPVNKWSFVSVVVTGSATKFYVDGLLVSTAGTAGMVTPAAEFYVGQENVAGRSFVGRVAGVAAFPAALSDANILDLWYSVHPLPAYAVEVLSDAPVVYWQLTDAGFPYRNYGSRVGDHLTSVAGTVTPESAVLVDGSAASASFASGAEVGAAVVSTVVNNFTVEAWVRISSTVANQTPVYVGDSGGGGWGLFLSAPSSGSAGRRIQGLFGGVGFVDSGVDLADNTIAHVVLVRNAGVAQLYVNGSAAGSTVSFAPVTPSFQTRLKHTGDLGHVAVYETALSPTRIAAHYAAGTP